jgi:antitoxin HicB
VLPLIAAKLTLHDAMRGGHSTPARLAGRLGVTEAAARRLLDLRHRSRIEDVEAALAKLGKRIEVTVSAA